jgi:hypothetical protein
VNISDPHQLLDPYRYFGYLFEKNAYPDVLDTCSKKEYVSGCSGYPFKKEYVSGCSGYLFENEYVLSGGWGFN